MHLSFWDWLIIAAYIAFSLAVGIFYARRASRSSEEYYLAGRSLPWWILGTSMVATTFAADTPLAITEYLREDGIWKNWFWWSWLLSGLLGVFLFSRLWRRARVLTDNELLELRYSGKPAAFLRGYKAIHFGVVFNLIVMGWVMESMSSVLAVTLEVKKDHALIALAAIALVYCLLSGYWGVVVTDLVQFVIAMAGAIILAILAVHHTGGMAALLERLDQAKTERAVVVEQIEEALRLPGPDPAASVAALEARLREIPPVTDVTLSFLPRPPQGDVSWSEFLLSPFAYCIILLLFMPWNSHQSDGGGGYIIQRMSSAKNEKHALMGTLWYSLAQYALRVWPWVIVAMVSLVLYPDLADFKDVADNSVGDKAGYPLVMKQVLGPGLIGLLVVSFLAAFMSTIDTHLNWGSSYLVNDFYRRFLRKDGSFPSRDSAERHYVLVGRIATVLLMVAAAFLSTQMNSISKAWNFVWGMSAGVGLVLILRWFWWRINAWSEIVALAVSFLTTLFLQVLAWRQTVEGGGSYVLFESEPVLFGLLLPFHLQLLVIIPVSAVSWLLVTWSTAPVSHARLQMFYDRVQPGGWWGSIDRSRSTLEPVSRGILGNYLAGLAFIYGCTFSIGCFVFLRWVPGILLALVAFAGWIWIWKRCIQPMPDSPSNSSPS